MPYTQDLANSAQRYFRAAHELFDIDAAGAQPGCIAVAGYLYGLAGELALKEIMRNSGMRPQANADRREDPFYAHFPQLKTMLKDTASGQRSADLRRFAQDPKLFQNWATDMRYAPTKEIDQRWVADWREQAHNLLDAMRQE